MINKLLTKFKFNKINDKKINIIIYFNKIKTNYKK